MSRARRADPVSSQGAYPAPPAVPSVRSPAGGTALSSDAGLSAPVALLLGVIAAYHRESREAALLRAVAHYADTIGIAALARPMQIEATDPTPALRADPPLEGADGRRAQAPP